MDIEFQLLGPLRVSQLGAEIPLPSVKHRLLLASLLLRPNEAVGAGELLTVLWPDRPPASAAVNLRTYVSGLRQALQPTARGRDRLTAASGGYLLRVEPGERDLDRFEAVVARGRTALSAGQPQQAAAELAVAVGMWRGAPLSDLPLNSPLESRVRALEERRLLAEEDHAAARLAAGTTAADVIERLRAVVDQHPLRQRAWAQLMTALYRIGDVSGALDAFQQVRRALAEHTGLDPGPELLRLHDDILHHRAGADGERPLGRRPTQLPRAVPGFVGRESELAQLDAALAAGAGGPGAVTISTISGMAGIGKTALALRWAHRVADRFPDGQLYLNLRGYDDAEAVDPAEALHSLLEALGVPAGRIPATADARTGLYRSMLATRRMVIVLDNARDAQQVRPLLPGTGHCLVVITSRDQLHGLIAAEQARPLTLNVLTGEESRRMLGAWLGAERIEREPAAVAAVVEAAGHLPLALSIVAARIAAKPTFPLAVFAAELAAGEARLDALADGDVRRVFSWSYHDLSEPAACLFRLLGLHPGPDVTAAVAAALTGWDQSATRSALYELTRRHLVTEHRPGRYTQHDLLRTYARELVGSAEPADVRREALHRLYDHYLHTAFPAARLLQPQWAPVEPVPPLPVSFAAPVADHDEALDWYTAEREVLIRVVRQAADTGFERYAWQIAWAVTAFLAPRGLWQDQAAAQRIAVAAAERAGDLSGQAMANRMLARAEIRLGGHDDAMDRLAAALRLYEQLGDLTGQAQTLHSRTELAYERGRPQEALAYGERALRLHRRAGTPAGEGRTLNAIGYIHATLGEHRRAIEICHEALAIQQEIDDRNGMAATLDSLGLAHAGLGDHGRAAGLYEQSIRLFRESADRYHEAETLTRLGDVRAALGEHAAAAEAWRRAAQIYDALGDSAADRARQRLDRLAG
ncbi:SARP family transcriptional regulator [Catellatospora sp. IY07-71]|uniref:AfsR/SARP family transcriptional regulator n=1 Tax=Catellatospora sp. IY07-71 TaxID=2728827 RepID=UPI001BB36FED|nr:BTAD domain-containing putative transcriptional regulator [Catellatospora sp. IY07-71]BCJ73659.1 SARP family transcriptional regulator [Catellatospora sp. IY07-71]